MTSVERIKSLCKLRGISVKELEAELGFARSSLWKIDTITPSSEKVDRMCKKIKAHRFLDEPSRRNAAKSGERPLDGLV